MVELNTFNSILSWIVKKDLTIPAELLFASLAEWKVRLILLHCNLGKCMYVLYELYTKISIIITLRNAIIVALQ